MEKLLWREVEGTIERNGVALVSCCEEDGWRRAELQSLILYSMGLLFWMYLLYCQSLAQVQSDRMNE